MKILSLCAIAALSALAATTCLAADAPPALPAHSLAVGDKTLSYLSTGRGPAVIVVHGVGGHKEDWQGVAAALGKTHRVYAIDMLGFGGSSKNGDDLSMPVQARAIRALLDHQHIKRADLVGNSVGGWVTACLLYTSPSPRD